MMTYAMGFYGERILPWFTERALSIPEIASQRRAALAEARGRVLEIGFGFGGSIAALASRSGAVERLTGLEPSRGMTERAAPRIARAPFPVEVVRAGAERMPFESGSFDTVVSTWTLCSIGDLPAALSEIRRVLATGGRYLFLEHGLAESPRLARWQRRLNPVQRLFAGGCRLDVPVDQVVRAAGFTLESFERYRGRPGPAIASQMYRGAARPEPRVTPPDGTNTIRRGD